MIQHIEASLGEAQTALANLLANPEALASIDAAAQTLIASLAAGGRIFPAATAARCATPCISPRN